MGLSVLAKSLGNNVTPGPGPTTMKENERRNSSGPTGGSPEWRDGQPNPKVTINDAMEAIYVGQQPASGRGPGISRALHHMSRDPH